MSNREPNRHPRLSPGRGLLPLTLAALSAASCTADSAEVRPPADQLFFPTGLALAPDESVLFVLNANSDLRYDSGSLSVVKLDVVDSIVGEWTESGVAPEGRDCAADADIGYTLICDESEVLAAEGSARIGNFATEVAVQELESGAYRLFAAVRGDPSLTYLDYDAASAELSCGGSGEVPRCDDAHRLVRMRNDEELGTIPPEPFGLFVDSGNGYVAMTHLSLGAVSLADAPTDGRPPILSDAVGGLFEPDPNTGLTGAVGVAGRRPGAPGNQLYVTSLSEARVQVLTVSRIGPLPALLPAGYFFLRDVGPSDDSRGIAFSAEGERAYIVNRNPPLLHIFDTSLTAEGIPENDLISGVELCSQASHLVVGDAGRGERVYVACFRDGQIWSIDPLGGSIEAIIKVGRGPQSIAIAEDRRPPLRDQLSRGHHLGRRSHPRSRERKYSWSCASDARGSPRREIDYATDPGSSGAFCRSGLQR